MEMEKINDNTMRVTLGKEDLDERGISLIDLMGNQHDVEDFFYSILDEVDTDHEFQDNGAVTFQLVPSGDGVELFITKVDPEAAQHMNLPRDAELDENNSVMLSNLTPDELDDIGLDKDVTKILKDRMKKVIHGKREQTSKTAKEKEDSSSLDPKSDDKKMFRVIEFDDLQSFIDLAKTTTFKVPFISDLFTLQNKYYLVVKFTDQGITPGTVSDIYSIMLEYGKNPKMSPAYLEEHGLVVKARNAYEWFTYNFS